MTVRLLNNSVNKPISQGIGFIYNCLQGIITNKLNVFKKVFFERMIALRLTELLEVIQVNRHDFLNHLQVISGLLQLNKIDQLQEYINKTTQDIGKLSVVTRLKIPELKAVLLIAVNNAHKHQVELIFDINTNMAGCNFSGEIIALAVEECINKALAELSPPSVQDRRLLFSIVEDDDKYNFIFGFPGLSFDTVTDLESKLAYCHSLTGQGLLVGTAVTDKGADIYLQLPRGVRSTSL